MKSLKHAESLEVQSLSLHHHSPSKKPASFLRHRRLEASGFLSLKICKRRLEASRVGLPPRGTPRRGVPRRRGGKGPRRLWLALGRGERWVLLRRDESG